MDLDAYDLTASLPLDESGRAAAKAFSSALSPLGRAVKVVEQQCLMLQCMSPVLCFVQVFGRRPRRSNHPARRPASEKRQGTKSREV
jgi:hypothetical protein